MSHQHHSEFSTSLSTGLTKDLPKDLAILAELQSSPDEWIEAVISDFDRFLQDHASCEKKASGMALNVASHYPDQSHLLDAMVDLAVEELNHYREVIRLLRKRGVTPGPDEKDPYINQLNKLVRKGAENYILDRLLIGAVVERRGAERFALIASSLADKTNPLTAEDPSLAAFYRSITASEERHWEMFVRLAATFAHPDIVAERFAELTEAENTIMQTLPIRSALH